MILSKKPHQHSKRRFYEKFSKKITFLICAISISCSFTTRIGAVKLGGKLINGPRNILYTVNGGANDYTYNINNGAYNWMYTGYDKPIYMSPVSSTSGSTIDFYTYEDNGTNAIAYTIFLILTISNKPIPKITYGAKFILTTCINMILRLIMMLLQHMKSAMF